MPIHIETNPRLTAIFADADRAVERFGYQRVHRADSSHPANPQQWPKEGGPFLVVKDGELIARFSNSVDRDRWLQQQLQFLQSKSSN